MAAKQIPSTFRKLVATRMSHKFRDVANITEVQTPKPGEGEVLVKNRFVGINASDINFTAGRYDPKAKFPLDIGFEAVGEVVAAGPNSTLKEGQPVMYLQYGAFSDYKIVKANFAVPVPDMKPDYLPFLLSGNTAAIALDKVGEIKSGETVLVTAAAGGTGQIAVQWAKLKGCHVIGTCSTDDKVEFLKSIGCDRPVNYKKENLKEVLAKEYPKGIDVAYESVGGEMFDTCVDSIALHGRLVIIGFISKYQSEEIGSPESSLSRLPRQFAVVPELSLKQKGRLIIIGYITGYESNKGFTPSRTLVTLPARLLPKSASVRGFFLFNYAQDIAPYVMQQVMLYKEGKLKSFLDNGEKTAGQKFMGLEKVVDAVDHLYSQKSIGKIIVELNSKL